MNHNEKMKMCGDKDNLQIMWDYLAKETKTIPIGAEQKVHYN